MKRTFASALIVALIVLGVPVAPLAAAPQVTGTISGLAREAGGQPAANVLVRLRNLDGNQVAGIVRTEPTGAFTFTNVPAGRYVIEIVDSANRVLAASAPVALAEKATMGGLIVTLPESAKAVVAAGAAGGSLSSSGAAGGSIWSSGAAIAMLAAIGAEVVVGVLVANADTSPKK